MGERHMKKLGLQLWTIRDVFKTEDEVKHAFFELAKYGYHEVETAGFPIAPEKFAEYAKEAGLEIVNTHYSWDEIENNLDKTIEFHKMLGTKYIGIGGLCNRFKSKDELIRHAHLFNEIGEKMAEHCYKFTYHNHSLEFQKYDGKTWYSYLMDIMDGRYTCLELDTYWAQHGGMDVCALLRKLAGKTEIIHLKDMAAHFAPDKENPDITEIGNGNLNFEDIIPLAESLRVEHFIVEQDRNWRVSPLESARESAAYLKEHFGF